MATIHPKIPFDEEAAAKALKAAIKSKESDAIINVITAHTNKQRQAIRKVYKTAFGKELIDDLKSALSGDLEDTVLATMNPPREYDAKSLRKAMKGMGTDEAVLIELMCGRTNDEIKENRAAYKKEFSRDLEKDIIDDTSGHFQRLLVSQCNASRDESGEVNEIKAKQDAQKIYDAGEGQWGTEESVFNSILCLRNYRQLRHIFRQYQIIAGKSIVESIESETSGDLKDGYLAIVKYATSPALYFAERAYKSMKGLGTDEETLIRVIVSRSEIDLETIKSAFQEEYDSTLVSFVEDDCSGGFKEMLLKIIHG